jgi:hypothetical protein
LAELRKKKKNFGIVSFKCKSQLFLSANFKILFKKSVVNKLGFNQ